MNTYELSEKNLQNINIFKLKGYFKKQECLREQKRNSIPHASSYQFKYYFNVLTYPKISPSITPKTEVITLSHSRQLQPDPGISSGMWIGANKDV